MTASDSNGGRKLRRWWPRKVENGKTWCGYMAQGWLTVIYIGPFTIIHSREPK